MFAVLLAAILSGLAASSAHAQMPPPTDQGVWVEGGSGDVEIEVLTNPLEVSEGGSVSYRMRLTEPPLASVNKGKWWVRVFVNDAVRADGYYPPGERGDSAISWVPSVGWVFDTTNYDQWRTITVYANKPLDTPITFTHEVWASSEWCPRHERERLTVTGPGRSSNPSVDQNPVNPPINQNPVNNENGEDNNQGENVEEGWDNDPGNEQRGGSSDPPAVTLSLNPASIGENGGQSTVSATASPTPQSAFTVTVAAAAVSPATAGDISLSSNRTLSFAAGANTSTGSVTITAVDNRVDAEDKTFTVTGSAAGISDVVVLPATLTIVDDDAPPEVDIADAHAAESASGLVFTVSLNSLSGKEIFFAYATRDGTAKAGSDYEATTGTLTFSPGEQEKTLSVPLTDDDDLEGDETFTVSLSGTANATPGDSDATGTIADDDGLSALSIADARVTEGTGPLRFEVTRAGPSGLPVTVDWATSEGTATAGEDYTKQSGVLTFRVGEKRRTLEVAVLDDALDEDPETLSVVMRNPTNATLEDDRATGTIDDDAGESRNLAAGEWMSRFGRTVATHVVDAVGDRLTEKSQPESYLTLGSVRFAFADPDPQASRPAPIESTETVQAAEPFGPWVSSPVSPEDLHGFGPRTVPTRLEGVDEFASMRGERAASEAGRMEMRQVLSQSSFRLASVDTPNGSCGGWTAWGRGDATRFDGREGDFSIDGDVMTTTLGVDYAWGRTVAGVAVSHSYGEGEFRAPGVVGDLESSLVSVHPYLGITKGRLSTWAMLGYGLGRMRVKVDDDRPRGRADLDMRQGALGLRGELFSRGDFSLAVKSDAFWVEMSTDSEEGMTLEDADASRLRLLMEGSGKIDLASGALLEPSLELGLRRDGGEAETGSGFELGAELRYTDPSRGLAVELNARRLLAHAESAYEEWGVGGSIRLAPNASGLGPVLSLIWDLYT